MKKTLISRFDSKIFSICYLLYSVIAWTAVLIIQILHKTNYDNQNLTNVVHVIVPVFCAISLMYSILTIHIKTNWLISLALLFCFIAELLGALSISNNVVVFVGCHVCLIIYFCKVKSFSKEDVVKLIPILCLYIAYVLFCFLWLIPRQNKVDFIFKFGVPAYGLLLCAMLWRAICTYKQPQWLLYGVTAVLFFLSDLNVLVEAIIGFGRTDPLGLYLFTWITYPLTITLVSLFNRNTLHFVDLNHAV